MRIAPQAFEEAVRQWVQAALAQLPGQPGLRPIAIDGKTLCGTLQPDRQTECGPL